MDATAWINRRSCGASSRSPASILRTPRPTAPRWPHAVEGRVPFLDHRFFETVREATLEQKIRGTVEKHVLREAMKADLPEEVIARRKHPLVAPPLLDDDGIAHVSGDLLTARSLPSFFDIDAVQGTLERLSRADDHERKLWDPPLMMVLTSTLLARAYAPGWRDGRPRARLPRGGPHAVGECFVAGGHRPRSRASGLRAGRSPGAPSPLEFDEAWTRTCCPRAARARPNCDRSGRRAGRESRLSPRVPRRRRPAVARRFARRAREARGCARVLRPTETPGTHARGPK